MDKKELVEYWKSRGIVEDKRLLDAFLSVPREKFILDEHLSQAYDDYPLPISGGQTISQPTTVMIMINALELKKNDKVLEIGAGSGYCAAIMSKIAKEVYTTEIIPELVDFANKNLEKANIQNVFVIKHDGSQGYEKEAPYDKIMVTAACPEIPKPLMDQLKEDGIIVAPVSHLLVQKMIKGIKKQNRLKQKSLGEFSFVPLKGKYGY
jgi:protein-L-isoaspartate(D-aspartate) O-methyltransferase